MLENIIWYLRELFALLFGVALPSVTSVTIDTETTEKLFAVWNENI